MLGDGLYCLCVFATRMSGAGKPLAVCASPILEFLEVADVTRRVPCYSDLASALGRGSAPEPPTDPAPAAAAGADGLHGRPMTEAEWLACDRPMLMLRFLRGKTSDRKLRLFVCAGAVPRAGG